MDQEELNPSSTGSQRSRKPSLLAKSAKGATFLIVLQIGSRALTFAVNQLLLRYLSPELLGISTQLEVYSISVLFFARESVRVAIQRQTDAVDEAQQKSTPGSNKGQTKQEVAIRKTQEIVNLAYISILLGFIFSFLLAWAYLRSLRSAPSILATPYFMQALQLYGIATLWELLAEPCFVVVQQKSEYKVRAAAESAATVLRCLVTCACTILAARKGAYIGVLPFAFGQGIYGLVLLSVYFINVRPIAATNGFSLMVRSIASE
jgi:oligosaccharide translocation protein RFT1